MIVGFQTNFCEDIDKYIEHKAPVIENIYSMMRGFCEVWKQPYRQQHVNKSVSYRLRLFPSIIDKI